MPETRVPRRLTATWGAVQRRVRVRRSSRPREIAISVMVIVILGVGVVGNFPDAAITRAASPVVDRIALPLGLDQRWSMYAPDPPRRQEEIEVHVAMADGTDKVWTLPHLNPLFGIAFSPRWRKFKENLLTEKQIRPDFVHWVVRELTGPGDRPVYVEMLLRTEELLPPGVTRAKRTAVEMLYSEKLTENR
jgi:hypothetical protein